MPPLVSVVVLNWNGIEDTRECLESLFVQTYPRLEIHVVDNGSEGKEAETLEKEFGPRILLHKSPVNLGFTGGNNLALREILRQGRASYIALLNNDAVADPNWVAALVKAAEEEPGAGFFTGKTVFYDDPGRIENAGIEILTSGDALPRGRNRPSNCYPRKAFILGACAGAALYRTTMLREIGLFREDFFANFEDVDLSLRAQAMGWKCLYVPEALVRHRLNRSIHRVKDEDFDIRSLRNLTWATWVNLPWQVLTLNFPWMVIRVLSISILSPLFGQPYIARVVLRALSTAWSERRSILKERTRLKPHRKGSWVKIWMAQKTFISAFFKFFKEVMVLRKRKFFE